MKEGHNETAYFVTRHSKSGKDVESSPGLSQEGVDLARERALQIAELVTNAQEGSVILFGGVSQTLRTRSTMELYADEVEKILEERGEQVRFIKKEELKESADQSGYLKTAQEIAAQISEKPDQKVVMELSLLLKEFSMEHYLYEEDGGTVKPDWQALLDRHGKNYSEAIKDWFSNPELSKSVNPEEMAKNCIEGMERLADFAKRFFPDRPLKIGFVGHSFITDALLTYMANEGTVTTEGFEKLGGEVVEETELATIDIDTTGNLHLLYRGKDFISKTTTEQLPDGLAG